MSIKKFVVVASIFNACATCQAQDWNPVSAGPATTWTAPLCGKDKFVVQPYFFYNRARGTFSDDGHYNSLPKGDKKYQYQEQFFIQYGMTDKFELDAQAVYQKNYGKQGDLKAHSRGFGDSYFFARYCLIEEKNWIPHATGLFQLKIPTGKYQHADPDKLGADLMGAASGGGSCDQGLGIILTKRSRPFILHLDAVYNFPQVIKVDGIETRYANYLNLDVGIEYFLFNGFNLSLEANGFLQGDKMENDSRIPDSDVNYLVVATAIGWSCSNAQMLVSYQRTLLGINTDANDSAIFAVIHTF